MNEITITVAGRQVPMNFGIGAIEAFCEANGIADLDLSAMLELLSGPKAMLKTPEFLFCAVANYHDLHEQPNPLTPKDIKRFIDLTGGPVYSSFKKEAEAAFARTLGFEVDPGQNAEIVNAAPAKNSPGRNSAPKHSAKSA